MRSTKRSQIVVSTGREMFISLCIIFVTFPLVYFSLFKFKKLLIEMFLTRGYARAYHEFKYCRDRDMQMSHSLTRSRRTS